jgi:hypothetical protein
MVKACRKVNYREVLAWNPVDDIRMVVILVICAIFSYISDNIVICIPSVFYRWLSTILVAHDMGL